MMSTDRGGVEAARRAEAAVWKQYNLSMRERFIDVKGRRVRVLETGNPAGTPLVFVQGGLGEAFNWASLLAELGELRCITLDRPGGGLSDSVDFLRVDVRGLAADVLSALLDNCNIRGASFVANSMGGWWTIQLALAQPTRVAALALLGCPAVLDGTSAPLPMRILSLPLVGERLVRFMVPPNAEKARGLATMLGHPKEVGARWGAEAEAIYAFAHLSDFRESWRTLLRRFLRWNGASPEMRITPDQLKRVTQPALFVWGAKDPFGSVAAGRAAARHMPNARFEVVGIGHLPWWDDVKTCATLVRDFCRAQRADTAQAAR
jgi:pimeloyl-ACP methyl ester carboxylesterase